MAARSGSGSPARRASARASRSRVASCASRFRDRSAGFRRMSRVRMSNSSRSVARICSSPARSALCSAVSGGSSDRPCRHEFFEQRIVLVVLDHLFLAGEIPEERHVRYPGRRGDLLDSCCVIALLHEQSQRVLLDRVLGRRLLAGAPVAFGHGVSTPTRLAERIVEPCLRSPAASVPRHARWPSGATNSASRSPRRATDVAQPLARDVRQGLRTEQCPCRPQLVV